MSNNNTVPKLENLTRGHMTVANTKPKLITHTKPELITITKMGTKIPMSHRLQYLAG